ncbi:HNH endonuclease signature motif containing protein [Methylobacter tundripaludum]|uniref:HNH endonuclease signature motif containing protein n=2 Tax=Methylobacter tundripaludum TaxID=173365 RepID=UPI000B2E08B1|nr:HNH endonuclease signature motif containing protein [Methylobacter tundripaludum]
MAEPIRGRIRIPMALGYVVAPTLVPIKTQTALGSVAERIPVLTKIQMGSGFVVVSTRALIKIRMALGLLAGRIRVLIKIQTVNGCAHSRSNMALNLAPFGRWALRDRAEQRRIALRYVFSTLHIYKAIDMAYENERPYIPAEIKRQVMTEAGHCCSVQQCSEHIVEIHHIDENRENNDPNNLILLCDKHHKLAHQRIISRMDLRKYKELLTQPVIIKKSISSEHDCKVLIKINDIFPYETILLIKNEIFGKFVKGEVISPFYDLFYQSEDPLFKFTEQRLETIKIDLINKGKKLIQHFGQQSAGWAGGGMYI